MAAEIDLFSFLKTRNIPDTVINQVKLTDDKIDINVIDVTTEEVRTVYQTIWGQTCTQRILSSKNCDKRKPRSGVSEVGSHAESIQASLEDVEVNFGPVDDDGDNHNSTLPWNPHDFNSMQHSKLNDGPVSSSSLPASPDPFEKELHLLKLRQVNIVDDVLNIFMEPKLLNANLKMEFTNAKAVDSDGVSREVYSTFWEHFLEQCEGEDERVPRLRPDYSEKAWQALGRVWLKGYLDLKIIPIRLSPVFVLACCQGLGSVDEELLMMSFARFLSENERASLEKALQGNIDETVEDDLLDIFSRMGSHCLPSEDNMRAAILTMAHKALLQEPKFIIDCFHSSIHTALPTLITKESVIELYESKRPTNKKVAQMIKPSTESLNPQEQTALNHLLQYVRSINQRKLEIFLRFCTASTVLCTDTIESAGNPNQEASSQSAPPAQMHTPSKILLTKEYLERIATVSHGSDASQSSIESSGDDYIPSRGSLYEGSSEEPDSPIKIPVVKPKKSQRTRPTKSSDEDKKTTGSENCDDTNLANVSVLKLQKKKDGARVYSKTHYCFYCPIRCNKMSQHLTRKHSRESAVAEALSFPVKSKERKLHFDLIRNKGNRAHNNEVLKTGIGTLIPSQQTTKSVKASDYMHCVNCQAFLKRKTLWRHMSRCRLSQKCSTSKPGRSRAQALCAYAQPVPDGVSRKVWELVSAMHQDEVTAIIRKERSILKLGEHLYAKHGHDKTKHDYIRQKMREIGRLVQQSRKDGTLKRIKDFYVPSNFNNVVEAVKAVAGFDEDKNTYKTPSLALNLNRSRALFEKKSDVSVSCCALQTLKERKWNSSQVLPFTEDVKIMHMHLEKCREENQRNLKKNPNKKTWTKLATVTLAEVILFNRRREGEVSKMTLSAFTLRENSAVHSDVALGLSELEQKLCQH
ncbi:DNA polymerase epsilon catalytic subunit A [Solea senegalensis]|uniref:DNA polymerase epsilon catalytic subunit A n=1 Tax=Solea senegalensis TaxID=28829 RepID=A0AAV6RVT2_SOLSE|nr:DNA polymerase epsilon catalytic subunit A [Solea senegalensis]